MRILLIKPFTRNSSVSPPLGLGYLASSLDREHKVKILDGDLLALTPRKLSRICREENPDLVGIQTYSANLPLVKEYLKGVRFASPRAVTVGTAHISIVTTTTNQPATTPSGIAIAGITR